MQIMPLRVPVVDDGTLAYPGTSSASFLLHANQYPPKTAINCQRSITRLPHPFDPPNPARYGCYLAHHSKANTIPFAQVLVMRVRLSRRASENIANVAFAYFPFHLTQSIVRAHIALPFRESDSVSHGLIHASLQSVISSPAS